MSKIYLDNASTTKVDPEVKMAMEPFLDIYYANPSAIYESARTVRNALEGFRESVSDFFNCDSSEIIFTSGGTESNNLAIQGVLSNFNSGEIIISSIEHPSVLKTVRKYKKPGFKVIEIQSGKDGIINPEEIRKKLNKDTVFVSIMYANNEIGTIQPIKEISKTISDFYSQYQMTSSRPIFHTDACQATSYLDMDTERLGVDLLTINGSKIYAPKGIGVLYRKQEIQLNPLLLGGEQEMGYRGGTENLAGIAGLAKALELIDNQEGKRQLEIRDFMIDELLKIEGAQLNGSRSHRLPNNINISFDDVEGESLVLMLDNKNIEVATGSACTSRSLEPSHVIESIRDAEAAHRSVRITLGKYNTREEAEKTIKGIKGAVAELRKLSL